MELAEDYEDYLRNHNMQRWSDDSNEAKAMTQLGTINNNSHYFVSLAQSRSDEVIANMALILIRQGQALIRNYINKVCENFAKEGGFREELTRIRLNRRNG
jgi:four helix bundle suffix protein